MKENLIIVYEPLQILRNAYIRKQYLCCEHRSLSSMYTRFFKAFKLVLGQYFGHRHVDGSNKRISNEPLIVASSGDLLPATWFNQGF